MRRRTALWVLAAILGLTIAAAISWATSTLTSQHIGLASEPVTAGRSLAPAQTTHTVRTPASSTRTSTTGTTAAPQQEAHEAPGEVAATTTAPAQTSSGNGADDGSASSGSGRDD